MNAMKSSMFRDTVTNDRNIERLVNEATKLYGRSRPDPIGMRTRERVAVDTAASRLRGGFNDEEVDQAILALTAALNDEDDMLGSEWNAPEGSYIADENELTDEVRYGKFAEEVRRLRENYSPENNNLYDTMVHDMQAAGDILPDEACSKLHDRSQLLHKLDMLCRLAELHVKGQHETSYYCKREIESDLDSLAYEWEEAGHTVHRCPDSHNPMMFILGSMGRDMVLEELQRLPHA